MIELREKTVTAHVAQNHSGRRSAIDRRTTPPSWLCDLAAHPHRAIYVGGIADAVAYQPSGIIDLVIDWKTVGKPSARRMDLYRAQRRDYLVTIGAPEGLLVFVDTGELVRVKSTFQAAANFA